MRINVPNQITLARLALALLFFGLLSAFAPAQPHGWLLTVSFIVFLAAALSDVLDGYLARAWQQVTSFGRVVDPVVDKVMVCGAFVYFASPVFVDPAGRNLTGVAPWMVVVILVRELLVSAIRAHSEASGRDFGASWVGKLKMFVQSATVCVVLGQLAWLEPNWSWLRVGAVWLTVIVTGASIVSYVRRARDFLYSSAALGGASAPSPPGAAAPTMRLYPDETREASA